jgi:hypothetical protein
MPKTNKSLDVAKRKIAHIRKNLAASRGLTPTEADAAARAGLIPSDQRWWWTEQWQEGERQAERDLKAGRVVIVQSADQLLEDLRKA